VDVLLSQSSFISSGDYRYQYVVFLDTIRKHFCFLETFLEEGLYTLIVTTFKQGEEGPFILSVGSSVGDFALEKIKGEGEGMFTTQIEDVWDLDTAGGNPSSPTFLNNPKFDLKLPQPTNIK